MNTRVRSVLAAVVALAALFGGRHARGAGSITGVLAADVSELATLAAGQQIHVTLTYSAPFNQILQTYVNVGGFDVGDISAGATQINPFKQGDTVLGTQILWEHSGGATSGVDSFTCTANPTLAAANVAVGASPGYGIGGGVNAGDGAGGGDLVRTNGLDWTFVPSDLHVAVQATVTPAPKTAGTANPGATVHYVVTGTASSKASNITLTDTLPDYVSLVAKSVSPAASSKDGALTWTFPSTASAKASFDVQIASVDKIPPSVDKITDALHGDATLTSGDALSADAVNTLKVNDGTLATSFVDANPFYLPDVTIPDPGALKAILARDWTNGPSRTVTRIAAEGVSLLLLRTNVDSPKAASVRYDLVAPDGSTAAVGGLTDVTDVSLFDKSSTGGARDASGDGAQTFKAAVQTVGKDRFAYALYRAPRDFDGDLAETGAVGTRTITVRATAVDKKGKDLRATEDETLTVVRPLVVLQHGTFDSPAGWKNFPLWKLGGNADADFVVPPGGYPFQIERTSFAGVSSAAGHAIPSAMVALRDFERRLQHWADATKTAAAQADVVTHSYGGVVMRLVAQGAVSTDPDNPLTVEQSNFRSARNWGHGLMHKFVSIAATHRGSDTGNHLAVLNHSGVIRGLIRDIAASQDAAIDEGAVEDQMVLSPLLRTLAETPVPCHALVGSGLCEYNAFYANRYSKLWDADNFGGPYSAVGKLYNSDKSMNLANFRKISNYAYNLDYYVLRDDTLQDPNYDLTVSSYSMKGLMPRGNYSDHTDIESAGGFATGDLVGHLTHGDEINIGASGDAGPTYAVTARVLQLLHAPTTSPLFAHFPAASSVPPTPLENTLSVASSFDPAWLLETTGHFDKRAQRSEKSAAAPTLSAPGVGSVVNPGQQFEVDVSWPGETVQSGYAAWPGGVVGDEPFLVLDAGTASFTVAVSPNRRPGPFSVVAYLIASDGTQDAARLDFDVEDAASYVAVKMSPDSIALRTTSPVYVSVEGKLASGEWQDVLHSSRTTFSSGDPTVASIDSDGAIQAVGIGTTTITANVSGAGGAQTVVTVSGESVAIQTVPRKTKPVLKRSTKKQTKFAFVSTASFDARRIDATSISIGGFAPDSVAVSDVNHDRRPDLVVGIVPSKLGLAPGGWIVPLSGITKGGAVVLGSIVVTIK